MENGIFAIFYKREENQGKSIRSFNNYIKDLLDLKLMECDRANMRGNVRVFHPAI
jgi:hypothetical protein